MSGRVLGAALVRRRDDDALANLPLVKVFNLVPVRLVLVVGRGGAATESETRDAPHERGNRTARESTSASALARTAASLDDGAAEGRSGRARELGGLRTKETELRDGVKVRQDGRLDFDGEFWHGRGSERCQSGLHSSKYALR